MFCNFSPVLQWHLATNWHLVWHSQLNNTWAAWKSLSLTKICSRPKWKSLIGQKAFLSWINIISAKMGSWCSQLLAVSPWLIHHADNSSLGQFTIQNGSGAGWRNIWVVNCPCDELSRRWAFLVMNDTWWISCDECAKLWTVTAEIVNGFRNTTLSYPIFFKKSPLTQHFFHQLLWHVGRL